MRQLEIGAALALLMVTGSAALAGSYGQDPQVIPGIGPETAGLYQVPRPQRAYAHGYGDVAHVAHPNYGGGLLEAILGDSSADDGARAAYVAVQQPYAAPVATGQGAYTASYDPNPGKIIDPIFQRQKVAFDGPQQPGTIVIDTTNKFLYFVEAPGQAVRYGIGVGRPGFLWHGEKTITRKAEWPDWTPPAEMVLRRPDLPAHMDGGMANPLGARAMYLGSSLYRIHGTNEPETIGTNVSSGCIRLTNDDVTDLYSRVRVGTHVIVM